MYYFFCSWIIFKCPDDISILIGCMRDWWKNILSFLFLRYQINKYKVRKLSRLYIIMLHYLLCIYILSLIVWQFLQEVCTTLHQKCSYGFCMQFIFKLYSFLFLNSERDWTIKKCSRNCIEHDFSHIILKLKIWSKVQILWEGYKIKKKTLILFWNYWLTSKQRGFFFSNLWGLLRISES